MASPELLWTICNRHSSRQELKWIKIQLQEEEVVALWVRQEWAIKMTRASGYLEVHQATMVLLLDLVSPKTLSRSVQPLFQSLLIEVLSKNSDHLSTRQIQMIGTKDLKQSIVCKILQKRIGQPWKVQHHRASFSLWIPTASYYKTTIWKFKLELNRALSKSWRFLSLEA